MVGLEQEGVEVVIYAHISSSDQKNDLERQIQYLIQYCSAKGYRIIDIISDIARFIQSLFGELRVSEAKYEELPEEVDESYPKYLEYLSTTLITGCNLNH